MKLWAKAGLIGFIVAFVGLWAILFLNGHDENGWKCVTFNGLAYCNFLSFISSFAHWLFVLFFSWVGFLGGVIDSKIIQKIIKKGGNPKKLPLKITLTIMLSAVILFAIIGLLILDNWGEIMLYSVIFVIFIMFLSWIVGRYKFGK